MIFLCLLCVGLVGVTLGNPSKNGYYASPQRAVMFGGYYSNPLFRRSYDISPQGSMSAVVTRDTVATNSYAGLEPSYPSIGELPIEENETVERYTEKAEAFPPLFSQEPVQPVELGADVPQEDIHLAVEPAPVPVAEEEAAIAEEVSTEAAAAVKGPKRAPKKKVPKPVKDEDDEEDLSASWPFAAGKGSVPSYNAFFPITITGGAPSRSRKAGDDDDELYPGSATAIANSFSTGKGGIATSHATSFGDPYLASLIRKGLLNFRSKNPQNAD